MSLDLAMMFLVFLRHVLSTGAFGLTLWYILVMCKILFLLFMPFLERCWVADSNCLRTI